MAGLLYAITVLLAEFEPLLPRLSVTVEDTFNVPDDFNTPVSKDLDVYVLPLAVDLYVEIADPWDVSAFTVTANLDNPCTGLP
jgi:hypothetical protein